MKKLVLLAFVAILFTSCYNTRVVVGDVNPKEPLTEVDKVWTNHFILGLIPGGNARTVPAEHLPAGTKDYVVRTNTNFWNAVVGSVTMGIYTPTQTKYYVPFRDMQ